MPIFRSLCCRFATPHHSHASTCAPSQKAPAPMAAKTIALTSSSISSVQPMSQLIAAVQQNQIRHVGVALRTRKPDCPGSCACSPDLAAASGRAAIATSTRCCAERSPASPITDSRPRPLPQAGEHVGRVSSASAPIPGTTSSAAQHQRGDRREGMAVDLSKVDCPAGATARTEHVEPWRAGEQGRPDRRRPQHVAAGPRWSFQR
jgi:hypothetical protein